MDHRKIRGPVRKNENSEEPEEQRKYINEWRSESWLLGLADAVIAIVSIGQKEEAKRS